MPDIVASLFKLENERGYFVPKIAIQYMEKDTGAQWTINCGGTRAYFIKFGSDLIKDFDDQSADSHFMANRIVTALFLSAYGLFRPISMGRLIIENFSSSEIKVSTHLDIWRNFDKEEVKNEVNSEFSDWYGFICQNTLFRRAADDAYAALSNPIEADFFLYRGMEWLLKAANIGWSELANDIGVPFNDLKKFKRQVNDELGQRHGIKSGRKRRANSNDYGSMVADFIHGLGNVRKRIDQNFAGLSPERAAQIVMKALPLVPYP